MKQVGIFLFTVYFVFVFGISLSDADGTKSSKDNNTATGAVKDTAKELKEGTVKIYQESKDAIIRDAKAMKEDIPRGLKEAKDSAVLQSKDVKQGATQELKEIRNNISNPKLTPKTESK